MKTILLLLLVVLGVNAGLFTGWGKSTPKVTPSKPVGAPAPKTYSPPKPTSTIPRPSPRSNWKPQTSTKYGSYSYYNPSSPIVPRDLLFFNGLYVWILLVHSQYYYQVPNFYQTVPKNSSVVGDLLPVCTINQIQDFGVCEQVYFNHTAAPDCISLADATAQYASCIPPCSDPSGAVYQFNRVLNYCSSINSALNCSVNYSVTPNKTCGYVTAEQLEITMAIPNAGNWLEIDLALVAVVCIFWFSLL